MTDENTLKIKVNDLYVKFKHIAGSKYYDGKRSHLFKDEKNRCYYLWSPKSSTVKATQKVKVTPLILPLEESELVRIVSQSKGIVCEDDLEKIKKYIIGKRAEKMIDYRKELSETIKKNIGEIKL